MRKSKRGGIFLCLLMNLLLNLHWTIPSWILLALHFWLEWPIGWFWLALGLWLAVNVLWAVVIRWAGRCSSTPDEPKENKNPYSAGMNKQPKTDR